MELHGQEFRINPFILCALGAAVGAFWGVLMRTSTKIGRVEEALVGVFGAFAGGDFLLSVMNGPEYKPPFFSPASLGMAVGGALVMLVLLRLMRGAVGPLRATKRKQAKRF